MRSIRPLFKELFDETALHYFQTAQRTRVIVCHATLRWAPSEHQNFIVLASNYTAPSIGIGPLLDVGRHFRSVQVRLRQERANSGLVDDTAVAVKFANQPCQAAMIHVQSV